MPEQQGNGAHHWDATLGLVRVLLAVWFVTAFGLGIVFVEPLNAIKLGGFPLGFWFAQQGSIFIFILLIVVYAWRMDRIDDAHGLLEVQRPHPKEPGS